MNQSVFLHPGVQWRSAVGFVRLLRLSNSLPASILVLIGAYLAGGWPLPHPAWQAALAMWCVTAFGYVSNDYFDVKEDSVNKPDRPIPAGVIAPSSAAWLAGGLALCAIAFSLPVGLLPTLVACTVLGLLTLYNLRLKATPGGGNLLIACLAGCTLLVGSVATLGMTRYAILVMLAPASVLSTFIAAREILKALEDMVGDRMAGKQTIATRLGKRGVLRVIALLSGLLISLSLIPFIWLGYSRLYLLVVNLGVSAPLLFTTFYLWQETSPQRISRCLALLKGSYFAGLVALLLA